MFSRQLFLVFRRRRPAETAMNGRKMVELFELINLFIIMKPPHLIL